MGRKASKSASGVDARIAASTATAAAPIADATTTRQPTGPGEAGQRRGCMIGRGAAR